MGKKGSRHCNGARLGPRHKQPGSTRYCKDIVYNTLLEKPCSRQLAASPVWWVATFVGKSACRCCRRRQCEGRK